MTSSSPARPKTSDEAIRRKAAESLAEDCAKWEGNERGDTSTWIESLLRCHDWMNGYRLARDLESRFLVDPDADLVEILDNAYSHLRNACDDAVRTWVKLAGFSPAYEVGDVVTCRQGTGPVYQVNLEMAQYVVDTEGRGNGGYVIDAEDVSRG